MFGILTIVHSFITPLCPSKWYKYALRGMSLKKKRANI